MAEKFSTDVYSWEGKATGTVTLPASIFGVEVKKGVVHRAARTEAANRRHATADTKGRGEVRGGGKKPWAQKGTGRARHGSIRSPLWKGGGVSFGPKSNKNYTLKLNRKEKRLALAMILAGKYVDKQVIVLEDIKKDVTKTSDIAHMLSALPRKSMTALILASDAEPLFFRAVRNLPYVKALRINSLNATDLLSYGAVIFPKSEVKKLEQQLASVS